MPQTPYYNENAQRSYPFVADDVSGNVLDGLTDQAVVDAGFMVGVGSGFVDGTHRIWLSAVARDDDQFTFTFLSDAPGLADKSLVFTRAISGEAYETEFVEFAEEGSVSESSSVTDCTDTPWTGFLVTGNLSELADQLANGESYEGEAYVEDALVQNLSQSYVRSVNMANGERTRSENREGCNPVCWPVELQPLYVNSTCLTGPIRFKPGFNSIIEQNNTENSIIFSAQVGAGEGEPCEEVPLYEGEASPTGSSLLSGGPGCNDVIRSIAGVGGRVLDIVGGLGITVTSDPDNHKVTVNVDAHDMAVCFADAEDGESVNCPPADESVGPCDCGPAESEEE